VDESSRTMKYVYIDKCAHDRAMLDACRPLPVLDKQVLKTLVSMARYTGSGFKVKPISFRTLLYILRVKRILTNERPWLVHELRDMERDIVHTDAVRSMLK